MDRPPPLRARQRARLVNEIWRTAHRLFAERGFDAVTTDEIASAAGISKSTLFRYVAGKDGLLVDPMLEGISGIVTAFESQPAADAVGDALAGATVACVRRVDDADLAVWRAAIRTAPQLIGRVTLVSAADRDRLVKLAAHRMDVDPDADLRPGLLVTTMLAASEHVFRNWLTDTTPHRPPLPEQVDHALRLILSPDWATRNHMSVR